MTDQTPPYRPGDEVVLLPAVAGQFGGEVTGGEHGRVEDRTTDENGDPWVLVAFTRRYDRYWCRPEWLTTASAPPSGES